MPIAFLAFWKNKNMVVSGKPRILQLSIVALACVSGAFSSAFAAPASITFSMGSGTITPAGAVPFDQWITATSSTPVTLPQGEEFAPTAILEYCGGSQKGCAPSAAVVSVPPDCSIVGLPVSTSCSLQVTTTPTADMKSVSIRVDIPPLRFNRAYRLRMSIIGKKEVPLTAAALQRVDSRVNDEIQRVATGNDSPTAADICEELVAAVRSEFMGQNIQIDTPLLSCAMGTASTDQIAAMEMKIEDAINSRLELLEARRNNGADSAEATAAARRDSRGRDALRGAIREVVSTNTWIPVPLGTHADAVTTRSRHISADAGLVYGWDLDESITYLGANIYSRPINTDVSLAQLGAEGMLSWRHRFSFTLGATLGSIDKAGERKGIIGSAALVVGFGWRLTDVIRLSGGALVFKEENPNPLVTNDSSLTASPYVGISFDIDVAKQFSKVFVGLP